MGRALSFVRLPWSRRWLLIKAAGLLAGVRLTLWLCPYPVTRKALDRASRRTPRLAAQPAPIEEVAWAVDTASRFVPRATHCLTKAMAAKLLLVRRGYPADLCFGVPREPQAHFVAHAWVESNGIVVVGGPDVGRRYVKLTS